jgi:hypothetical protein
MPCHFRMCKWKPVTKDKVYVVIAFFMLMGILQKPTLWSYFSKNSILATSVFGCVISVDELESIHNLVHFNNCESVGTYQGPSKLLKIYPVLSHLNQNVRVCTYPGRILQFMSHWCCRGEDFFSDSIFASQLPNVGSSCMNYASPVQVTCGFYNLYSQRHFVPNSIHFR